MNRRSFLAVLAGVGLAGCTTASDPTTDTPTADPGLASRPSDSSTANPSPMSRPTATPRPSLDITAVDAAPSTADVSLSVRYDTVRTERLPTHPPTAAEATHVWLMVRVKVTNVGDRPRELTSHQYGVDADGETVGALQLRADWRLSGRRVAPDETATGWLVFHIPDYVTEATLRVRDITRRSFAVSFDRDRSLDTTLPQ